MKTWWLPLILMTPLVSGAVAVQKQSRVYRVGILFVGSADYPALKGLREGLEEAGYLEGKNLILDMSLKKSYDELRPIARAYEEQKIDVIVAVGDTTTAIAREATQDIPIVFIHGVDPLRFVKSLARPGTNITGLTSYPDFELQAKRLEVFKDLVPTLRRVVVLYNARVDAPHHTKNLQAVQKAASRLEFKLAAKPIKTVAEVEQVLSLVSKQTTDGIFIICSGLFRVPFKKIATIARQRRLPINGCDLTQVAEQGGLWMYAPDGYLLGYRAAWYVNQILRGAKPQDLPVETPAKFELVINLKTAKEIGINIPPEILILADKVFQ
jgi:putative ABC transport system substrate-binding protein